MQPAVLAVDAGRTRTSAVVVRPTGEVLTVRGTDHPQEVLAPGQPDQTERVLQHVVSVAHRALTDAPTGVRPLATVITFSGGHAALVDDDEVLERLVRHGLEPPARIESDLAAAWFSATPAADGAVLMVGTGAIAARIDAGQVSRVADGLGWILGAHGSGYWLGRRAAMAAADQLDGRGPVTALTASVLAEVGVQQGDRLLRGRPAEVRELSLAVHRMRPGDLARLAPLVLRHGDDPVAGRILDEAASELARTVGLLGLAPEAPLVLEGSLIGAASPLRARLLDRLDGRRCLTATVPLVGVAMLGLRASGAHSNQAVHQRLVSGLAA